MRSNVRSKMLKYGLLGAWFYRYAGILAMDGWLFCFFYCYGYGVV